MSDATPAPTAPTAPPVAEREATTEDRHGTPSPRPYAWMKDREDPRLLPLLEAENAWARANLAPLDGLRDAVYEEVVGYVQEDDDTAPTPRGDWEYFARTRAGVQQAVHCRRPRGGARDGSADTIVLDENVLAESTGYCNLGALAVSPDQRLLAYALDVDGAERFTLQIRDLTTGEELTDVVGPEQGRPLGGALAWGGDSAHLYYTVQDETHRPFQLWRHVVGTTSDADVLVLEEGDERYWMGVGRERSGEVIVAGVGSSITSEAYILDAHDPAATPVLVAAREEGVDYQVEHRGDELWVTHNRGDALDFALARVTLDDVRAGRGASAWVEALPHRAGVRLLGVAAFAGHLAVVERVDGLPRVRAWWPEQDRTTDLVAEVEAAVVGLGANAEYDSAVLRITVDTLVTPTETIDIDLATGERTLVKRIEVPGYDADQYVTRRLWATADDGERVPITIAHRAEVTPDGSNPCHVYGYGSYEITVDPDFHASRLPMLDRGVVYAIVHVRGGGAMGRRWYEDGKFGHKMHTFTDTLACTDHLIEAGWADSDRISLQGRSAGGLLVGAAINMRPGLYAAASAEVPFVDCRATMWDPSIPLTVLEYDEWGNPAADPEVDEYIRSYTPTENITDTPYPALLVTSGINDPRVAYWEPTLWVQEHRHVRSDDRPVLLRTELGAGHFGPSGRYGRWKEDAEVTAFLLHHIGADSLLPRGGA
ncbi:MAG: oligopeptidase B [Myxococcota bacterium]